MSRVIADGLSKRATATTQEAEDAVEGKYPDAAGVHAAFNQYGLGAAKVSDETDIDLYTTAGSFIAPSTSHVNFPPGLNGRALITVNGGSNSDNVWYVEQIVQQRLPPYRRFVRAEATGSIGATPWREIYHQESILGTVSQSAGVPTGAIIEAGSNANGSYTKFADGTMICTNNNFSIGNIDVVTGNLFRTANQIWTYPVAFVGIPVTSGSVIGSINSWIGVADVADNRGYEMNFAVIRTSSATGSTKVKLSATGRWY